MNFDLDFYKGKKVFVTGHTGFKGSWLCKIGYCISFYSPAGIPFRIKRKIKYIYSKVTRK